MPKPYLNTDMIDPAILNEALSDTLAHTHSLEDDPEEDAPPEKERIIQIIEGGKTNCLIFALTCEGRIYGLQDGGHWLTQNLPEEIDPDVKP
jgi:hypothetical protein